MEPTEYIYFSMVHVTSDARLHNLHEQCSVAFAFIMCHASLSSSKCFHLSLSRNSDRPLSIFVTYVTLTLKKKPTYFFLLHLPLDSHVAPAMTLSVRWNQRNNMQWGLEITPNWRALIRPSWNHSTIVETDVMSAQLFRVQKKRQKCLPVQR